MYRKCINALCASLMGFVGLLPVPIANAEVYDDYKTGAFATEQEISAAISQYSVDSDGVKRFDSKAAEDAGVDINIINVGLVYNEMLADEVSGHNPHTRLANPLNRWRYCGKYNSGPGEPLNSADEACRRHDKCLAAGTAVRWCDSQLVYDLRRVRGQYSGADRVYIEAAIQAVPRYHGCPIPG